mmetsp:Transcript_11200/g.16537  ORF Transcript_11200/g.16537 Transcript_11200/m.16537 type:complete len:292 (-) Transcript_11200:107-982(-)
MIGSTISSSSVLFFFFFFFFFFFLSSLFDVLDSERLELLFLLSDFFFFFFLCFLSSNSGEVDCLLCLEVDLDLDLDDFLFFSDVDLDFFFFVLVSSFSSKSSIKKGFTSFCGTSSLSVAKNGFSSSFLADCGLVSSFWKVELYIELDDAKLVEKSKSSCLVDGFVFFFFFSCELDFFFFFDRSLFFLLSLFLSCDFMGAVKNGFSSSCLVSSTRKGLGSSKKGLISSLSSWLRKGLSDFDSIVEEEVFFFLFSLLFLLFSLLLDRFFFLERFFFFSSLPILASSSFSNSKV